MGARVHWSDGPFGLNSPIPDVVSAGDDHKPATKLLGKLMSATGSWELTIKCLVKKGQCLTLSDITMLRRQTGSNAPQINRIHLHLVKDPAS